MNYSIIDTHEKLKNKLRDYIIAQYLGDNQLLLSEFNKISDTEGVLYRKPYIEMTPSYAKSKNGFDDLKLPGEVIHILKRLSDSGLGVYDTPYKHQTKALEEYYDEKDLIITTGTGSGKTECFLWPTITDIINETRESSESWQEQGIRVLMLYPMNALVTDQISRLRHMIGDEKGKFKEIINDFVNNKKVRYPKFGMYTGRTPYPGKKNKKNDKRLGKTLDKDLLNKNEEIISKLKEIGKYPAKYDLDMFVRGLENSKHITHTLDSELITRQEMQQLCPDILITNYSMLEYMLMRPIENDFWIKTKKWLDKRESNKLKIIIDEAHMYRGAAGGEVALLIHRLLDRIGVSREKVQFILTSASIPENKDKEILKFANSLTAKSSNKQTFSIIRGETDYSSGKSISINFNNLLELEMDKLNQEESVKKELVENFLKKENFEYSNNSIYENLYDLLSRYNPVEIILKNCSKKAMRLEALAELVYPNQSMEKAIKATENLLKLSTIAKKDGQVLLPTRLHMLFRGLDGIYACSNPNCSQGVSEGGISLGKIYFNDKIKKCEECHSKVYELVNDRRCGALFLKGYMHFDGNMENFVWNILGEKFDYTMKEVHFYIHPNKSYNPSFGRQEKKVGYLNALTGKFYEDDSFSEKENYLKVAFSLKEHRSIPDLLTFHTCPKCKKSHMFTTNFKTKGNESFYNIIVEQLKLQSPKIFDSEKIKRFPNKGRKVLLFSDSRQRAAKLARDLTRVSDDEAVRKVIILAIKKLEKWGYETHNTPSLDLLYFTFLEICDEYNLKLFYGEDKEKLLHDIGQLRHRLEKWNKRGRPTDYKKLSYEIKFRISLFDEQLLKLLGSSYLALSDLGFTFLEPCHEDLLYDIEDLFEDNNINMKLDGFKTFFSAWSNKVIKDSYSIGSNIEYDTRQNASDSSFNRFGIETKKSINKIYKKILKNKGYSEDEIKRIYDGLLKFTVENQNDKKLYINMSSVSLKYNDTDQVYYCERCSGIFHTTIWGHCVHCGEPTNRMMKVDEIQKLKFWREPVTKVLNNKKNNSITAINTEEHTAQLSYKDQRENVWSITENYEMQFQDVLLDDELPVDILSCTTTMEVGIDIGSLSAIGLRNIPPKRQNYQQRAGRAGRRSSSLSSIVTYIDNGPHDSYYFLNPEDIITGETSIPWIDVDNTKLIRRHLNMILINKYLHQFSIGMDKLSLDVFFDEYYENFIKYLKKHEIKFESFKSVLPYNKSIDIKKLIKALILELDELKIRYDNFNYEFLTDKDLYMSLMDVLYENSILPTYSFPKNVVGFHIEDKDGKRIIKRPDRSLDIAISEYAPGRKIVVDKKTYKSGGIYAFHSKFIRNNYNSPAKKYFENKEYFKKIYYCKSNSCGWFSTDKPINNRCPFCDFEGLKERNFLKPWGFAPVEGKSISKSVIDEEYSYAGVPYYSATPKRDDMKSTSFKNIKYAKRSDQRLVIVNEGPEEKGFFVCKACGASIPGTEEFDHLRVKRPYKHPWSDKKCLHKNVEKVVLGHEFNTDMVVYEFAIENARVNTKLYKNWIDIASLTVSEVFTLAAAKVLDIEFNEIKSGYRIRKSNKLTFVDIYIFDSLSSGAGYSSQISQLTNELIKESISLLEGCNCQSSCHECLNHFWNQRVQEKLSRKTGLQFLKYGMYNEIESEYSFEEQKNLFKPLEELIKVENNYEVIFNSNKIILSNAEKDIRVYIYPNMWNENIKYIPSKSITLSDRLIDYALPMAYKKITNEISFNKK